MKHPEIDTSLIEAALSMTPEERLAQHQEALNLVEALLKAKPEVTNGGSEPTPPKTPRS